MNMCAASNMVFQPQMCQQDSVWQLWLYASLKAFSRAAARMIGWHHMHEKKAESQVNGQPQTPKRSRSRAALFAGFGALLILMAIICIDSLHTLESFETRQYSDSARFSLSRTYARTSSSQRVRVG